MLKNTRLFRFCRLVSRGLLGISLDTASTITTRRADRLGMLPNVKQLKKIVYRSPIPLYRALLFERQMFNREMLHVGNHNAARISFPFCVCSPEALPQFF